MHVCKQASYSDLHLIAACHMRAFPESVPVLLGKEFVVAMLNWYLSAGNKFLFWIESNGACIGYCGGYVKDERDSYGAASGMTQFGFSKALKAMLKKPWLLWHPEIRSRYPFIFRNIKRKFMRKSTVTIQTEHTVPMRTAGLIVIGVLPEWQQQGIGSVLQKEFEQYALKLHAENMQLSVRKNNVRAIASYKRNGWHIAEIQPISYIMRKNLLPQ